MDTQKIWRLLERFLELLGAEVSERVVNRADPTMVRRLRCLLWIRGGDPQGEYELCEVELTDVTWGRELKVTWPQVIEHYVSETDDADEISRFQVIAERVMLCSQPNLRVECDQCGEKYNALQAPGDCGSVESGPRAPDAAICPACVDEWHTERRIEQAEGGAR